tara:strand:- start:615 stop:1655 length:1041 start_codon:yes stop_codon:yes gene_type:complete
MNEIEIIRPDDWHVHFRDNDILKAVVPETSRHFGRAIVMPNLIPPITTRNQAIEYKNKIEQSIPKNDNFTPLMTVYLTENIDKKEIEIAYNDRTIFAAKLYPAGATTNSQSGVKDINKIMPILEIMTKIGMPLLIHGEVTDKNIDIFDREKAFIDQILDFICKKLPELKITLEHITTNDAALYVSKGNKNLAASITPHHLALNRNAIFDGGIRPHNYCLPILKREFHRKSLLNFAISGNEKFFLGTDTAPHLSKDKESACGCAGVFNATYSLSVITQIFDNENSLSTLEKFVSKNGAKHYNLPVNKEKIKLTKLSNALTLKDQICVNREKIKVFDPGFPLYWKVLM